MKRRRSAGKNTSLTSLPQPLVSTRHGVRLTCERGVELGPRGLERSELLELVFDQLSDAIIVCDPYGNIALSNAAARKLAAIEPEGHSILLSSKLWGRLF